MSTPEELEQTLNTAFNLFDRGYYQSQVEALTLMVIAKALIEIVKSLKQIEEYQGMEPAHTDISDLFK